MTNKINKVPQHKTIPTTPVTPDTGFGKIYIKSDGSWYGLDDQGVETLLSGGGGGGVSGSGTLNRIAKFTPDGTTIGNSEIIDNGNIGISVSPDLSQKLIVQSTGNQTAIRAFGNGDGSAGVYGVNGTSNNGINLGLVGEAANSSNINIAIRGLATAGIGTNHAIQLQDGTQTVGGGKYLRDMGDGLANWANITATDVSGVQGALTLTTTGSSGAATLVGNTLNIPQYSGGGGGVSGSGTLNYLTKFTPNGSTIGNSQIQDDGSRLCINGSINPNALLSITGKPGDAYTMGVSASSPGIAIQSFAATAGAGSNTGLYASGASATIINKGIYSVAQGMSGASTTIGVHSYAFNGLNNYSVQLQDGTETVTGRFLKNMTTDGKANWANITAADVSGVQGSLTLTTTGSSGAATLVGNTLNIPQYSGGGSGGVSGSGTLNYLTKWTPNGTTLGNSAVAENSTGQLGIGISTNTNVKLNIRSFTEYTGLSVHTSSPDQGSRAIYGSTTSASSSFTNYGVWGEATGNTSSNVGVYGTADADIGSTPEAIGGEFRASAGTQTNPCAPGATAVGISSYVYTNGGSAYFARFIKDVASSSNFQYRVVLSDNTEGYADWGKVTSSYTTGASGTFTSANGKTITVTNGLITSIV